VSDINHSYLIDSVLIKGLSVNRSENYSNYDYNLYTNLEEAGIRMYTHKFFSGYQHFYFMQKYKEKVERAAELQNIIEQKKEQFINEESEI
jgi:hypothetical protein